jgi:hypothetical protein
MKKLIRTTITVPEDIYKQAKVKASLVQESFSAYVTEALYEKINQMINQPLKKKMNPQQTLGVFSLGIKKILSRKKLYETHLQRKLGR